MTKQRRIIHSIINNSCEHLCADGIYLEAKKQMPGIAIGTVYRNLGLMVEAGEIRKIPVAGHPDRYDKSTKPHDHMLCEECGRLVDLSIGDISELIEDKTGTFVKSYELYVNGICSDCIKAKSTKN